MKPVKAKFDLESPASADEPAAMQQARAFFYGETDVPGPLPEAVAEALVDALCHREDGARLGLLATGADKALAKQARRGLHLLRSRGVAVDVPRGPAVAPRAVSEPEPEPLSLASAVVRDGERLVWFTVSDSDGIMIYQGQLSEALGLLRFEPLRGTRKAWRSAVSEFFSDEKMPVVPVAGAIARWLLEDAAELAQTAGRGTPRDYAMARRDLGPVTVPARHPAYEVVPAAALEAARPRWLASGAAALLALPEAASWIPDEEVARKALLKLDEVATSQLVVDEAQRAEQATAAMVRAADEALAGPWRARIGRRLRETAFVIAQRAGVARGQRNRDFIADAALALAAAEQTDDPSVPASEVVIGHAIFGRLQELRRRHTPEPARSPDPAGPGAGSLIVP